MQRTRGAISVIMITVSLVIGTQGLIEAQAVETQSAKPKIQILQITPETTSRGQVISLLGTGFATKLTQNRVRFSGSDADATILFATKSKLSVLVPDDADTGPVAVTIGKRNTTSTSSLNIVDVPDSERCDLTTDAARQVTPQMLGKMGGGQIHERANGDQGPRLGRGPIGNLLHVHRGPSRIGDPSRIFGFARRPMDG